MDVFDLVASITLDSSEYEEGLSDASNTTKNFSSKLGGTLKKAGKIGAASIAAVGAAGALMAKKIWSGTQELAEYGDHIDKMSQKMGISAQAYQEWDAVLQHSGTSIDSMRRGMTTLSQQAQKGADAFDKLGISQEQLASMSQEELFSATIEGLQKMEAGTERTALAQQLLGGSAKELGALLNTSAEETQKMKDRVHELGGVMSDEAVKAAAKFQDNMQDLKTAMSGVKRSVQTDFLPAANTIIEGFTSLIAGEEGAEKKLGEGMDKLAISVGKSIDNASKMAEKLVPQIVGAITKMLPQLLNLGVQIMKSIADGIVKNLPSLLDGLKSSVGSILDALEGLIDALLPQLPAVFEKVLQALVDVFGKLGDYFPKVIPQIVDLVVQIAETLLDNIDMIVDAAIQIVQGLADGLVKAIPRLVEKVPTLITKLVNAITRNFPKIIKAGIELFTSLVKDLPAIIAGIVKAIPEIITAIITGFLELIPGLAGVFDDAVGAVEAVFGVIVDFFQGIWDSITGIFDGADGWFGGIFSGAATLIEGAFGGIISFFSGIWEGIKGVFGGVASFFESTFGAAAKAVQAAFGTVNNTIQQSSIVAGQSLNAISYNGSSSGMPSYIPKKHAKGGVFYHSTLGVFGEAGAEAVVPLDQNTKWVHAVATDFAEQLSGMALASSGGNDIIIPVYIGQERIDEIVVSAQQRANYRSGGRG